MSFRSEGKKIKFLKGTTFSFEPLGKLTYKCVKPKLVITGLNVDESNSVQSLKYSDVIKTVSPCYSSFILFCAGAWLE